MSYDESGTLWRRMGEVKTKRAAREGGGEDGGSLDHCDHSLMMMCLIFDCRCITPVSHGSVRSNCLGQLSSRGKAVRTASRLFAFDTVTLQ
jgi:hypothetical protein